MSLDVGEAVARGEPTRLPFDPADDPAADTMDLVLAEVLAGLASAPGGPASAPVGPAAEPGGMADLVSAPGGPAAAPAAGPGAGSAASGVSVLDCGGGSGRRAVPLAELGALVTVIDVSIDALAILARRAAEAGVADRVTGVQADVEDLAELAPAASVDLILLHDVLGATPDAGAVLSASVRVLRPGGYLSVVVANPVAVVLARALNGDLAGALGEAAGPVPSSGARLDLATLTAMAVTAGLEVMARQGLGAFSSLVPGSVLDGQPGSRALLGQLDRMARDTSPYREIAGKLHLLARKPTHPGQGEGRAADGAGLLGGPAAERAGC